MKKQDLENRMVVEDRSENKYLVVDGYLMGDGFLTMDQFNDDLKVPGRDKYDIMKIYKPVVSLTEIDIDGVLELLWERPWEPKYKERYYIACIESEDFSKWNYWVRADYEYTLLKRGLVFKTKEEAVEVAKKMLETLKGE